MAEIELKNVLENSNATQTNYNAIDVEQQDQPHKQVFKEEIIAISTEKINRDPKHKLWQLITFFRRIFIYFVVVALADNERLYLPDWVRVIFKCLPVLTLSVFIYRQFDSFPGLWKNKYAFLVFLGMNFSLIGDALLVFQEAHFAFFLSGLISFAIAHVLYTFAFGWKPFKSRMLIRSIIAGTLVYYYFYTSNLPESGLPLVIGVAFYVAIIFTMQWRAWARVSYLDITNGRWYELIGALGASFFGLSDAILGINKFVFFVPGADYSIIATYYVGQVLIALSVLDGPNIDWPEEAAQRQDEIDGFKEIVKKPSSCFKTTFLKVIDWMLT